ncbi:MAG: response regulator [Deltaproteobacteria bacterium]|nr:response regulator [Deltaproteobacteria bacterium]
MAIHNKKPRILIVDDDCVIRSLIKEFYEDCGFELAEAVNGQEAVEMARTGLFDLILLDMQMPVLSGYEVAAILKKDKTAQAVPIVVISGQEPEEVEARIKGLYDGYVNKPFKKNHLMQATMKYVQGGMQEKEDTHKEHG